MTAASFATSSKRARTPIACVRCHHKKVRCDGARPSCTRCTTTNGLCAYPKCRRSRNTQPTHTDPFLDSLSQFESRIRHIESELASQRLAVQSLDASPLLSQINKTDQELQESRETLAQWQLAGERRARLLQRQDKQNHSKPNAVSTTDTANPVASAPMDWPEMPWTAHPHPLDATWLPDTDSFLPSPADESRFAASDSGPMSAPLDQSNWCLSWSPSSQREVNVPRMHSSSSASTIASQSTTSSWPIDTMDTPSWFYMDTADSFVAPMEMMFSNMLETKTIATPSTQLSG